MTVDRTNLRSAALQAVFMNDHDGVAGALSQLNQLELKGLYEDAIKLASWVEGALETEAASPLRWSDTASQMVEEFTAPLHTYRTEREPDQLFQTGPMPRDVCGAHGRYQCSACYPSQP